MSNPETNNVVGINWKILFSLMLITFGIHMSIMFTFLTYQNIYLIIAIHAFLFGFIALSSLIIKKVKTIDEKKVGMTFLALTLFKMLFSIGFLLLMFNLFDCERTIIIFNFFGPFFIYLLFEVINSLNQLR